MVAGSKNMEQSTLEIKVISANDLKDVNLMTRMDVYAVVSISGDPHHPEQRTKTPIDREGRCNPNWNFPMTFTIHGPLAQQNQLNLVFKMRSDRALGDKDVGLVIVPIKELLDSYCREDAQSMQFVSYQVRRASGRAKGELTFSYKFNDRAAIPEVQKVRDKLAGQLPDMTYDPPPTVGCGSGTYGGPYFYPPLPPQLKAGNYAYPPPSYAAYAASAPPPDYAYPLPSYAGYAAAAPPPFDAYPPPQVGWSYIPSGEVGMIRRVC
uniref:Uncharacterized protein MANES_15G013300 n=1 Tax=Rhizophora mucronata TaxID=61149 RepID=A0A2P2NGU7_RHIMU